MLSGLHRALVAEPALVVVAPVSPQQVGACGRFVDLQLVVARSQRFLSVGGCGVGLACASLFVVSFAGALLLNPSQMAVTFGLSDLPRDVGD